MTDLQERPPLVRPRRSVLGGVSVALAQHLRMRVQRVRWILVLLTLLGGFGALLYLWLWALVPLAPATSPRAPGATGMSGAAGTSGASGASGASGVWAAAGTSGASAAYSADDLPGVQRRAPVAAVLVAAGAIATIVAVTTLVRAQDSSASQALIMVTLLCSGAVAWSLTYDRADPGRSERYGRSIRFLAVALLLISGSVALSSRPVALNAVLGVALVVLGVAVFAAPRVVTLWTDLMAERSARVRQQQRAEIAAHLHDSVLQTLALIQNRAGPSTEVARIARAQERELRDWLFTGDAPVAADLAAELREVAAAIELDYAVRIEVVAVGGTVGSATSPLVAAAREAMLNAARHAGGEVSVYLETPPGAIDVFVRDRGPGVDLTTLPDDRLGIRESIIGRMTRAGGSATVKPGSGGSGTEVHLHLEVAHD